MARMPGVKWRPITRNYTARVTSKDCILLHSTGTNVATSQYGWFNTPGAQASSHFHIDFAGNIEQYIDSDHISYANSAANSRSVTIETQGNGYGPWTAAQIRSIVRIIQWVRSIHKGIPLRQMTSSRRSQKGIGWHRLGCDGNFPRTGILRGRNQRGVGEKWTKHFGKICPGDDRIKQIPAIIRQANGHTTPASTTPSKKGSWFDMATKDELREVLREERVQPWLYKGTNQDWDAYAYQVKTYELLENLSSSVGRKVWSHTNPHTDTDIYAYLRATHRSAVATEGKVAGLTAALEALAAGKDVNLDEIRAAAEQGVSEALKSLDADITIHVNTDEKE